MSVARTELPEPSRWDGAAVLLEWWGGVRKERDRLPWRDERDPWRVLVAEVMLAQTQAGRVAERYPAVIARLSSPRAAAALSPGQYIELWSGLGYYRRALSLRSAALEVCERFDGMMPADLDDLLSLPGVGPYTARAVLAFASDESVGVLDTNIGRVLARAVVGRSLSMREAQAVADGLVLKDRPREWNLAVMDLGALVCRSKNPLCDACPLGQAGRCSWQARGGIDPAKRSAATARPQAPFRGSDREGRGRLVRAALSAPIALSELADVAGWPEDKGRAMAVASRLVDEGLLALDVDGSFVLPGRTH